MLLANQNTVREQHCSRTETGSRVHIEEIKESLEEGEKKNQETTTTTTAPGSADAAGSGVVVFLKNLFLKTRLRLRDGREDKYSSSELSSEAAPTPGAASPLPDAHAQILKAWPAVVAAASGNKPRKMHSNARKTIIDGLNRHGVDDAFEFCTLLAAAIVRGPEVVDKENAGIKGIAAFQTKKLVPSGPLAIFETYIERDAVPDENGNKPLSYVYNQAYAWWETIGDNSPRRQRARILLPPRSAFIRRGWPPENRMRRRRGTRRSRQRLLISLPS